MQADLRLKKAQGACETPRNIAIIAGTVTAIIGVPAGIAGYRMGYTMGPAMERRAQQIVLPLGTTIQIPPAPSK